VCEVTEEWPLLGPGHWVPSVHLSTLYDLGFSQVPKKEDLGEVVPRDPGESSIVS
jgi:hypothetical protein